MINIKRMKEDLFYFPERELLKNSGNYKFREDEKIKKFASDSLAEIYSPLEDINLPIITYSEGKYIKSWLNYIYNENKYFIPVFAYTDNLILISYNENKEKYNFHYNNDIVLKVYDKNHFLLEEHFNNKDLDSIFINSISYNKENRILIEKYNIANKYYHPVEVHKCIDSKKIKEMVFKNREIKEWMLKMDIDPFNIDKKMIELFNVNFYSLIN